MKFEMLRKTLLLGAATIFVWWAWKAPAQDAATINVSARVPYAVSQVIQLEQAKIGEGTVIAYIRNSGNSYNLTANDILYLRGQGVSDAVLTAMLTQPKASVANIAVPSGYSQPAAPAPQYSAPAYAPEASAYTAPTAPAQPQVTYVQSAPTTYYYPSSYYYPYSYYYPSYSYYGYYGWPRPWYGWGWGWWGGGWHWGGGGGWHGGWGGGGWHGSVGGGGFHGGGGGGFHGGGGHR